MQKNQALDLLNFLRSIIHRGFTDPAVRRVYSETIAGLVALPDNEILLELLEAEYAAVTQGIGNAVLCGPLSEALARKRERKAAPLLARMLNDPACQGLKEDLAEILGLLGDPSVEPNLQQALTDTEAGVRAKAVTSLAQLGCRQAGKAIAKLLDDDSDTVREAAEEALSSLDGSP